MSHGWKLALALLVSSLAGLIAGTWVMKLFGLPTFLD